MNWLQLSDADRVAAVNIATRQLGFNANVIEKDWWVVMALKALFGSSIKDFASSTVARCRTMISSPGWRCFRNASGRSG